MKLCDKCKQRPGTEIWAESGVIGWVHGIHQNWCMVCVLTAQLAHARQMAEQIPELQAQLDDAECRIQIVPAQRTDPQP